MKNIPLTIKIFDLFLFIKKKNKNWKTSVFSNFGVGGDGIPTSRDGSWDFSLLS